MSLRWVMMVMLYTLTACATNTYALISGYVGVDCKKERWTGFALLWLRVVWYGVLITLGFALFSPQNVSWMSWLKAIFPVSFHAYWYFTSYFILIIFRPFLNLAVRNLSKIQLGSMIVVLFVFVCIPALLNRDVFQLSKGFSPWWLIILYLVGAYIRLYGLFTSVKTRWIMLIFILLNVVELFRRCAYNYLYFKINGEIPFYENMTNYVAITTTIAAVCLILIFERINLKGGRLSRYVRKFAPLSFSVYLIHVNQFVWDELLTNRFSWIAGFGTVLAYVLVFGISALIFIVCLLIDLPRETLFIKLQFRRRLDCIETKLAERVSKCFSMDKV